MTKNKMTDLNDHLFAAIERLEDESLTGDELKAEIDRSRVIAQISKHIVDSSNVMLSAARFQDERMGTGNLPKQLGGGES